jgi:hypothetical protein
VKLAASFSILLTASSLLLSPTPACAADGPNADRAQVLFDAALGLMDTGAFADACPKLAESHRLDPAYGSALNLGYCLERLGKLASAERAYRTAERIAAADARDDRRSAVRARLATIANRVHRIRVRGAKRGANVAIDGNAIEVEPEPGSNDGILVPVDPGEHELVVSSTAGKPIARRFFATDAGEPSEIVLPAEDPDHGFAAVALPPADPNAAPAKERRPPERPRGRRTIAIVTGAAGLAFLAGGATFGVLAADKHAGADRLCPQNQCTTEGLALDQDADRLAWASNVGLAIGIAAIATATVLWITAPKTTLTTNGWGVGFR